MVNHCLPHLEAQGIDPQEEGGKDSWPAGILEQRGLSAAQSHWISEKRTFIAQGGTGGSTCTHNSDDVT